MAVVEYWVEYFIPQSHTSGYLRWNLYAHFLDPDQGERWELAATVDGTGPTPRIPEGEGHLPIGSPLDDCLSYPSRDIFPLPNKDAEAIILLASL